VKKKEIFGSLSWKKVEVIDKSYSDICGIRINLLYNYDILL